MPKFCRVLFINVGVSLDVVQKLEGKRRSLSGKLNGGGTKIKSGSFSNRFLYPRHHASSAFLSLLFPLANNGCYKIFLSLLFFVVLFVFNGTHFCLSPILRPRLLFFSVKISAPRAYWALSGDGAILHSTRAIGFDGKIKETSREGGTNAMQPPA